MEYVQMTLDDWVQMKQKLRQELVGVKQSFVRIGYALRQIDDQRLYENDGYKSIAEFAKAEYGLEASTTSRFISINREYSIDGYSEHLRPEYADLGRSQLEEMLKLPDADRQMIQPEASREDIRELKRFNKTEPAAGVADDTSQLIEKFFEDNKDILNEVYSNEFDEESMNRFAEIVNPAGNRSFKKGLYFMMMYENRVTIKKFGDTPKNMSWWEFYQVMRSIFDEDAAGTRTWQNHFGGDNEVQENEPTGEHTTAETPEPEDDNAAVGEAGTDEVEETESGSVADNEPAPGAGEEQKDAPTDRTTDCREDNNRIESAIREDGSVIGSRVQGILDAVKTQFHALRDVAQKQDVRAMLFEDLNPDSPTFGAMCLGSMGFEIASKRTSDGKDWIWSTFGTGQGFFADYIIAGTMLADRIYGGTLTLGGRDNKAGIMKILNGSGAVMTTLDKDGILTNGRYTCGSDEFGRRAEISEGEIKIMDKSGNTVGRIFAVSNEIFKIGTENALFRMFKTGEVYVDCQSFGVNGYNGFTGTVEYSDGTYENYVGGLLIGGKSKEGAYP